MKLSLSLLLVALLSPFCALGKEDDKKVDGEVKKNKTLAPPDDCIDTDERCGGWAKDGECSKNPWMLKNCQKSCESCRNAWGTYDWVEYDDSYERARKQHKPIMFLIHKSWCPACKALKKTFSKAKELMKLSKHFIMVNLQDEDDPDIEELKIDGNYIPRIYFTDEEGNVMKDVINKDMAGSDNIYFYPNPSPILKSMRTVMKKLGIKENKDEL